MAIAIDVASLGNASASAAGASIAFNTGAVVANAGTIYCLVHYNGTAAGEASMSGGGLTWQLVSEAFDGAGQVCLFRAHAPSGLASATTLTASFSTTPTNRIIAGCSFTGVADASAQDSGTVVVAASSYTSATMDPTSAESLTISAVTLNTDSPHTPTAPSVEALDSGATFDYRFTIAYRIESSVGAYTNQGSYGVSGLILGATGVFGAAVAAGGAKNLALMGVGS